MGNYILYTDKDELFECKMQLAGAEITDAEARLVIESTNIIPPSFY